MHFGKPQLIAALMLLAFVLQCVWLASHTPITSAELQHHATDPAPNPLHSPLTSLLATLPARVLHVTPDASSQFWWLALRGAFTAVGFFLGAAVWYIARRLYGNTGGYIALALYCFSPAMIAHSATVAPEIAAAFGAFGLVWTAVATAHTLYAPREVVLWNWKRIVLLGIAIAVGVGAQFAVAWLLMLALALMFYLVPHRVGAAMAILAAGCAVAAVLLLVVYAFDVHAFTSAMRQAQWAEFSTVTLRHVGPWKMIGFFVLGNSAGTAFLVLACTVTFVAWSHARYFGTAAPLLTCVFLVLVLFLMPRAAGFSFLIVMLPFAIVFVAGVCADVLESKSVAVRSLATGIIIAVLITHALFSVVGLQRLPSTLPASSSPHARS